MAHATEIRNAGPDDARDGYLQGVRRQRCAINLMQRVVLNSFWFGQF